MIVIYTLFALSCGIITFFLVLPFLMVVFSRFKREKINKLSDNDARAYDFGCIITAYKNAEITKPLIASLIRQNYQNHLIYLVADECDLTDWDLEHENLVVLNPQPPLRLKAKSIIHAMDHFRRNHEYIVIFDADNLAHPDFLAEINQYINNGHNCVQGQRTAKNLDNFYACADSMGEFYKNYIDRYVPYLLGSSAVISGSGMAVEANLYKSYLESPEIKEGQHLWKKMLQEDKILQNHLLYKKEKISYAWNAVIYDEKVISGDQVETQRSRWLYSYFQNLPNSSGLLWAGIKNLNWNQFLFGLVTIAPPMFIQLFLAVLLGSIALFFNIKLTIMLALAMLVFGLNIFWVLYLSKVPEAIWKAVWKIPFFVIKQFTGLLKMGNPNKNFKHSEHTRKVSIEEVLQPKSNNSEHKSR